MKCNSFYVFSLVLASAIFSVFSSLFLSTTVSAIADYTFTFDSTTKEGFLCRDGSQYPDLPNCSDYKYVHISPSFSSGANFANLATYNFAIAFHGYTKGYLITESLIDYSTYDFINRIYFTSTSSSYTDGLSSVIVTLSETNPFIPSSSPSGSITLTENGTFDVTNYAEAVVDVPPVIEQGDYHDDLVDIKMVILLVPAVMIMLYLFFSIYKMLFRRS